MWKKIALLFVVFCTCSFSYCIEFDPAACPDLSVKIFPGNNKQSVLLVTASGYAHSGLGFDYAKCRVVGKLSKNTWRTLLHFEMTPGKKSQLYYLATIPQHAAKESDRFELAIDDPFFTGPKKTIPLQVIRNSKATVTFTSFAKSGDQTKILRELKINLTDNTAPCIALAAALIKRRCEDATMIVLPADHRITPVKRFQEDLMDCIEQAQTGSLTILGVTPDKPATGYGYINAGEKIAPGIYKVNAFKEKPDFETAQHYMMDGNYWWNCGIFVWQVQAIAEAFQKYIPSLYEKLESWANGGDYTLDFEKCEKISIDYAIMEKADNVAVKQASFRWNDLGTLGALYEITMKDFHENAISTQGKLQLEESDQNLIFCDDNTEIRLEKIKNCAVIKSGKSLLITTKW